MKKTIDGQHEFVQIIKKSRFITNIKNVSSEKEAKLFVQAISNKYHDARHNVFAYVVEGKEKYHDAGEPKGTAGVPLHTLLQQKHLDHIVVVVSRYFGGIKLGSGGLIRAYRGGLLNALDQVDIIDIEEIISKDIPVTMENRSKIENYLRSIPNISLEILEDKILVKGKKKNIEEIKYEKIYN